MTAFVDWAKQTFALGNAAFVTLVLGLGVALLFVRPRWGRRWLVALLAGFWFVSTPLGSGLLIRPLVQGYRPIEHPAQAGSAGAIVVLGGGTIERRVGADAIAHASSQTTLRVLEGARLFRLLGGRPLVVASGGMAGSRRETSESHVMAEALTALGVPSERILLDDQSKNTYQQAVNVTRLLRERGIGRIVLVTSPAHMRRSAAVFRAQRADLVPSISALTADNRVDHGLFVPNDDSLEVSNSAVYDYAGLAYYWMRGWLRPAPAGPRP